jgi:hypothetical protein
MIILVQGERRLVTVPNIMSWNEKPRTKQRRRHSKWLVAGKPIVCYTEIDSPSIAISSEQQIMQKWNPRHFIQLSING